MIQTTVLPDFDVIVVGGGPAGLSAALWCADLGVTSMVLERQSEFGGQLLNIYNSIKNYPGRETANGLEMRDIFLSQIRQRKIELRTGIEISKVDPARMSVTDSIGTVYTGRSLVVAAGIRRRRLKVAGESEFYGKGIIESGQHDKNFVKGKRLLIVGGGDAALENALLLADVASEITVAVRKSSPSARPEFVGRLRNDPRVKFLFDCVVTGFAGGETLSHAEFNNVKNGETGSLNIDAALIRIGIEPNTEFLNGSLELDPRGFIAVNRECETSVDGIFAVGDVANPLSPTISTAAGMGATAAKHILTLLNHKKKL